MLSINISPDKVNTLINRNLKNLTTQLNKNNISLNGSKTELTISKPKRKIINNNFKVKLKRLRLYPSDSVNCLGERIDDKLFWELKTDDNVIKLN